MKGFIKVLKFEAGFCLININKIVSINKYEKNDIILSICLSNKEIIFTDMTLNEIEELIEEAQK